MTTAVMFIGSPGVGKSLLLSLLGGEFESGVSFRTGFTKDIYERNVVIEGKPIVLMDFRGLFGLEETKNNAKKLTEALGRGYSYILYFVLKASNRGISHEEFVMVFKVNECVRQAGSKAIFRVIINQIQDKRVYDMYENHVARDNCRALFQSISTRESSFDITISSVHLLWYTEDRTKHEKMINPIRQEIASFEKMIIPIRQEIASTSAPFFGFFQDIFRKQMSFTREPSKSIDSARSILHAHPAHTPRNPQIPYSGPVDGDSVHEIGYLFFAELTPARPAYTPRNPQISYSGPVDGDFGHEIGYLFTDEFKDA